MTFTQLRCFIEVARQLNFARAAETLYISQPAVSRQIHALENELGPHPPCGGPDQRR